MIFFTPLFLSFLHYSSTPSLFHPPLFFCHPAPGVISKVSVGDSVLSLKSLRNHPGSLPFLHLLLSLSLSPSPLPISPAIPTCSLLSVRKKYRRLIYLFPPLFCLNLAVFCSSLASLSPSSNLCSRFSRFHVSHSLPFHSLCISLTLLLRSCFSLCPPASRYNLSILCYLPFRPSVWLAFITRDVHVNPSLFSRLSHDAASPPLFSAALLSTPPIISVWIPCLSLWLSFPPIFIPCTCSFDFRWVLTVFCFAHPSSLAFLSTNFVSLRLLIPPPLPLCFFSSFNPSLPSLSFSFSFSRRPSYIFPVTTHSLWKPP